MGVLGLWNLLEPVGKPVPIESLENKILAVDISIWLNQAVKGFRDRTGNAVPHAHLLGLYHRVCKLLFYRIKPVFVFDGQPPQLKRDTLIRRRMRKSKVSRKAAAASAKILENYLKSQAIAHKLKRQTYAIEKVAKRGTEGIHNILSQRSNVKEKDLFELPDLPPQSGFNIDPGTDDEDDDEEDEVYEVADRVGLDTSDIYNLDVNSDKFKTLPQGHQYDILSEMREKRKQNSWARIHQMPSRADSFSTFQLERLKHRRGIQNTLERVKKTLNSSHDERFNQELFVGDLSALKSIKKEIKKVNSNSGSTLVYAAGLQAVQLREAQEKAAKEEEKRRMLELMEEERELMDIPPDELERARKKSCEVDSEEEQLAQAIALSLTDPGPSQEELYTLIKQEGDTKPLNHIPGSSSSKPFKIYSKPTVGKPGAKSLVKSEDDIQIIEDDDILLLPAASFITSNRFGGQSSIKKEIKEEVISDTEDDLDRLTVSSKLETKSQQYSMMEIYNNGGDISKKSPESDVGVMSESSESGEGDDVGIMSDSSEDSGSNTETSKPPEDDLFSDIFQDNGNVVKLDEIISKVENPVSNLIKPVSPTLLDSSPVNSTLIPRNANNSPEVFKSLEPASNSLKAVSKDRTEIEDLLQQVQKLDKKRDMFSMISKSARDKLEKKSKIHPAKLSISEVEKDDDGTQDNGEGDEVVDEEDIDEGAEVEEVAKAMRSSSHLWFKVASKYAEQAIAESPTKGSKRSSEEGSPAAAKKARNDTTEKTEIELEQENLVKEMKEREAADRLLRFTSINYTNEDIPATKEDKEDDDEFHDEVGDEDLRKLGIKSLKAETYRYKILLEEGLISEKSSASPALEQQSNIGEKEKSKENLNSSVIFSSSVPGFSRSSKDKLPVVDVMNEEIEGSRRFEEVVDDPDDPNEPTDGAEEAELYAIQAELARENESLVAEMVKADRVANSITDQMYSECQELLQLFGIPWIVAPTEAEAQCAFLDDTGLTHGTITDDSDIWLFGGKKVYKNFFNQDKHVEMFNYEEISHHFGLDRDKLILLAMLTGSDYTEGVEGVGPVTALEIIGEFPGEGLVPLLQMKSWWDKFHSDFGKEYGMPVGNQVREKLRKLKLTRGFPSQAVMQAYTDPRVDPSQEKFTWAVPNLVAVRDFAKDRFGWTKFQIDEILKPVIRSLQRFSQGRIDTYFSSYRINLPETGLVSTSRRVEEALRKVKGLPSPQKTPSKKIQRVKAVPKSTKEAKTTKKSKKDSASQPSSATAPISSITPASISSAAPAPLPASSCSSALSNSPGSRSATSNLPGMRVSSNKADEIILQREERKRNASEARARAAEIFNKSKDAKERKLQKRFKRPARKELKEHQLSSDED